jgi:hypothetical protein
MAFLVYNPITYRTMKNVSELLELLTIQKDELNNLINNNPFDPNPAPEFKVIVATAIVNKLSTLLDDANEFVQDVDDTDDEYMDVYRDTGSCNYVVINGLGEYNEAVNDLWEAFDEYFVLSENEVSLEPIMPGPVQSLLLGNVFKLIHEVKNRAANLSFSVVSVKPEDDYLPPSEL